MPTGQSSAISTPRCTQHSARGPDWPPRRKPASILPLDLLPWATGSRHCPTACASLTPTPTRCLALTSQRLLSRLLRLRLLFEGNPGHITLGTVCSLCGHHHSRLCLPHYFPPSGKTHLFTFQSLGPWFDFLFLPSVRALTLPAFAECVTDTLGAKVEPNWRLPGLLAPAHHAHPRNIQTPRTRLATERTVSINSVRNAVYYPLRSPPLSNSKAFQDPDAVQRPWVDCTKLPARPSIRSNHGSALA